MCPWPQSRALDTESGRHTAPNSCEVLSGPSRAHCSLHQALSSPPAWSGSLRPPHLTPSSSPRIAQSNVGKREEKARRQRPENVLEEEGRRERRGEGCCPAGVSITDGMRDETNQPKTRSQATRARWGELHSAMGTVAPP